ncbi:Rpn family recombination-promoting nuclease/putative transposase, partial [Hydrogenophilus thiooxidans]|uniref:Rpn family recombination-promoting nuclease/putative transposase n=1 Tax=Hydrogenophilus thiooxidans TaxID=2820326 RepID=UPI001C213273
MTQAHDTGYKLLFAHPEMVRDLLIGFVPEPWVQTLDFSTLERINASYVSDKGDVRHEDMVWKVRFENHWLYVYLLLEFQAQPDRWMALRMLVYLGLLYQDLVRRNELTPEGKLPP